MKICTTALCNTFFNSFPHLKYTRFLVSTLLLTLVSTASLTAQNNLSVPSDSILITVFLKHQQDKNLETLQKIQNENKLWEKFPPESATVVSWYVMMGIGQVVTLKIPASELRTLNLVIEKGAWGAFDTEFYPTYDFEPIWKENYAKKPND